MITGTSCCVCCRCRLDYVAIPIYCLLRACTQNVIQQTQARMSRTRGDAEMETEAFELAVDAQVFSLSPNVPRIKWPCWIRAHLMLSRKTQDRNIRTPRFKSHTSLPQSLQFPNCDQFRGPCPHGMSNSLPFTPKVERSGDNNIFALSRWETPVRPMRAHQEVQT